MWIDSHAHLFDLTEHDIQSQVTEASNAGVGLIVSTATDLSNSRQVIHHCENHSHISGAAGISPFDVTSLPEHWCDDLRAMLDHPKIIAIGETGIDTTNPRYPTLDLQLPVFEQQLALARDSSLPIIIHSRGAEKLAADRCRASGIERAMFHCFTGDIDALQSIVDNGYYISLSGIVTFPRSDLRTLINRIPLDRLLIETDSPYLAPVPHRGKKNRPALVRFTGEEIARLIGKSPEVLQQQIENNFVQLFSKYQANHGTSGTSGSAS